VRIDIDVENIWAKAGSGLEPQRADLWIIDFREATYALTKTHFATHFFAASVSLPPLSIKAEEFRKGSVPYMLPGFDEAPGPVTINFIHDIGTNGGQNEVTDIYRSEMYKFLNLWRRAARAGRGGMSEEDVPVLDANYKHSYRFDVSLNMVRPDDLEGVTDDTDLEKQHNMTISSKYVLKKAWLSSLKISDLNYANGNQYVTIAAVFYVEDVLAV